MYRYTIELPGEIGTRHSADSAARRINELTGRNIGRYIIQQAIPATARRNVSRGYSESERMPAAYVAANHNSAAWIAYGVKSFRVRRETPDPRADRC